MSSQPDLGEFLKLSRPKRPPCAIGVAITDLEPKEQVALAAACETSTGVITNAAIVQWLAVRGHSVSSSALTSHRRSTCTCHD